jgi:D-cysteine desulfhydrase
MSTPEPILFRRYPQLRDRLAWLPLGRFPTPVQPLVVEGASTELWIKRDDLSGEPYGGNKVRKLEFILGEARRKRAGRLITGGAAGSHHALATAVYGRALGFPVSLVLFPQPLTEHVRHVVLQDAAQGATLHWVPRMELIPAAIQLTRLGYRRQSPFVIAPGGSDAFGTLGYVNAALELGEQIRAGEVPEPAVIHVAAGTLGTAAGLALGLSLAGLRIPIEATRVISRLVANSWALRSRVRATAWLLRRGGVAVPPLARVLERVTLHPRQLGRGYGYATPEGDEAILRLSAAGVALDPTYTGKAAAAMLRDARARSDGPVLFWHTLSAREPPAPEGSLARDHLPENIRRWLAAGRRRSLPRTLARETPPGRLLP